MKRLLFLTICFCAGLTTSHARADCAVSPDVISDGERLSYQLYYNLGFIWINAGSCDLKVKKTVWEKKNILYITAVGQTYPSFDNFFHVRDTFITYVDSATLIPYKSYKYTHEDKWHGTDIFSFRRKNGGWQITTTLKRKGEWQNPVTDETTACGFDILSSIYRLRCVEGGMASFEQGQKYEIPLRLDDGEYKIYLTYRGKERIKLHKAGYYSAHLFHLTLVEGNIFKRGDVLKMWVSDDGNNIPIMVESPIRVGNVKAIFESARKTRYPLSESKKK